MDNTTIMEHHQLPSKFIPPHLRNRISHEVKDQTNGTMTTTVQPNDSAQRIDSVNPPMEFDYPPSNKKILTVSATKPDKSSQPHNGASSYDKNAKELKSDANIAGKPIQTVRTKAELNQPILGMGLDYRTALSNISKKYSSLHTGPNNQAKQSAKLEERANSPSFPKKHSKSKEAIHEEVWPQSSNQEALPMGNGWHLRQQHFDPDGRKAVSNSFAEEQANIIRNDDVVDINSAEFKAGFPVLADGEEDVVIEKTRDKETTRKPDPTARISTWRKAKTANERVRERMDANKDNSLASVLGDALEEIRKLSKEEKRRMRAYVNAKTSPNIHAPKADIFLRPAEIGDTYQINHIWNWYVANTIYTPVVERYSNGAWVEEITQQGKPKLPFIVAVLKHGSKVKRHRGEHIVGFGRAIEYGDWSNAFRFTLELEVFVREGIPHQGIGKSIFDRLMASVSGHPYRLKDGAPFLASDNGYIYDDGAFRYCSTILVSILHDDNDRTAEWKKEYLKRNDFEQASHFPRVGFKLGRQYVWKYILPKLANASSVHMTQFYYSTSLVVTPDLEPQIRVDA